MDHLAAGCNERGTRERSTAEWNKGNPLLPVNLLEKIADAWTGYTQKLCIMLLLRVDRGPASLATAFIRMTLAFPALSAPLRYTVHVERFIIETAKISI